MVSRIVLLSALPFLTSAAYAQSAPATRPADAPRTWVDPDTGHRVHRLTDEPNSSGFYFNINAYTPDKKTMIYNAPDGIHALELATGKSRLLVSGDLKTIAVGQKTNTLFFTKTGELALYAVNVDTAALKKIADLPPRGKVAAINADETLAAGTFIEGDGKDYGEDRVNPSGMAGPLVQPLNKGQMMEERLAAKLPMTLFTVNLQTAKRTVLLEHDTNWLNHLLFSPTDPTLLMYCHEGSWHKVDRIWTIRTDGTQNQLIHKRTMSGEIAGHEFWGIDGKTLWYDLQIPRGEDFYLASYHLETKQRRWYHLQRNEWSVHFNITADESMMCGDGGDAGQVARAPDGKWIYLFRPQAINFNGAINEPDYIQPGLLRAEKLVNMSKHDYKLEPNVRFSPDNKQVFFTANFTGASYVYAADVTKEQ